MGVWMGVSDSPSPLQTCDNPYRAPGLQHRRKAYMIAHSDITTKVQLEGFYLHQVCPRWEKRALS